MQKQTIETSISLLLIIGITISFLLVLLGGTLYLLQFGQDTLAITQTENTIYHIYPSMLWKTFPFFTSIHLIELGLLILVLTQIARIALLAIFYISIKDAWFTLISLFIFFVLIYSLFWRS